MEYTAYINGQFINKEQKLEIISPIDLKPLGKVPALNQEDIERAFKSARSSFSSWKSKDYEERVKYINRFTGKLEKNKNSIADIMHKEIGKDVAESVVEIERTIEYINKTIEEWEKIKYKKEVIGNKTSHQHRIPLGVVLAISPFNYPINLSMAKVVPALLSGNTIVFKAATNGSLTGGFIAKLFDEINIPQGVFNYVTGRGRDIGDILVQNQEIDMITFTGGERVGKNIAANAIMKPLVLELGGNDAAYVRNDADLKIAVKEVVAGAFGYVGQRCTAIKRVILHKDIKEKFKASFLKAMESHKEIKPLINEATAVNMKKIFDQAIKSNSQVWIEGKIEKNYVSPFVIEIASENDAWNEEAFAPLLPIMIVENDQEAIEKMNNSKYGLQNSIFTEDIEWAKKISINIESGSVNINAKSSRGPDLFPFLGVKDSGFGTQGIAYALESMTRIINIVENK